MEALLNVTVTSLATYAGIINDGQELDDATRSRYLSMQLGMLQRRPLAQQLPIHSEFAAKYLPILAEQYRASSGAVNTAMTLMGVVSYTPYFVRFLRTPGAQGLADLHAKRAADDATDQYNAEEIGETCQFLATILLLQGIAGVDEADKTKLIPKLKRWEAAYQGKLAADTSERCLALLQDIPSSREMMHAVRSMLESGITNCGIKSCGITQQSNGRELMQCARCKSAVYVRPFYIGLRLILSVYSAELLIKRRPGQAIRHDALRAHSRGDDVEARGVAERGVPEEFEN